MFSDVVKEVIAKIRLTDFNLIKLNKKGGLESEKVFSIEIRHAGCCFDHSIIIRYFNGYRR